MKITNISFKESNLKLIEPFSYFTATLDYLPYVEVKIKSNEGIIGLGEASLAWDVTGETQEGSYGLLKYIKPLLNNHPIDCIQDIKRIMDNIDINIYKNSGLKSGIEFALLDLLGKKEKKPVYKILGGKKIKNVVAQKVFSYKEKHSQDLKENIQKALREGAKIIKFKTGDKLDSDLIIIKEVVNWFPNIKIVLDVNQGWKDFETAMPIIKKIETYKTNICWIEQPIFSSDYIGLSKLTKKSKIPIMADESCHDLLDLKNLHINKSVKLVNIKLAKCGGILKAIEMVKYCEANNIIYMLGDMINSQLGTSANLHMATLGNFISYDLTSESRLVNSLYSGLKIKGQLFYIPDELGLGIKTNN